MLQNGDIPHLLERYHDDVVWMGMPMPDALLRPPAETSPHNEAAAQIISGSRRLASSMLRRLRQTSTLTG